MTIELAQDRERAAADLRNRVLNCLAQKGVASLKRLNIDVTDSTVTFSGTVSSFYERQLCLSCKHIPGVRRIVDELKVEIRNRPR